MREVSFDPGRLFKTVSDRIKRLVAGVQTGVVSREEALDEINSILDFIFDQHEHVITSNELLYYDEVLKEVGREKEAKSYDETLSFLYTVKDVLKTLKEVLENSSEANPEIREEAWKKTIDEKLGYLDKVSREFAGEGCVHGFSRRLSGVLTDLVSCLHTVSNAVKNVSVHLKERDHCLISEDGPATQLCLRWSDTLDKSVNEGHAPIDVYPFGYVFGDKAFFELDWGQFEIPEKAVVDLGKGKVTYKIEEGEKRDEMYTIAEDVLENYAGLNCYRAEGGVECTGVNRENADKVARALAMLSGLYERLDSPSEYWKPEELEEARSIGAEEYLIMKWLKK